LISVKSYFDLLDEDVSKVNLREVFEQKEGQLSKRSKSKLRSKVQIKKSEMQSEVKKESEEFIDDISIDKLIYIYLMSNYDSIIDVSFKLSHTRFGFLKWLNESFIERITVIIAQVKLRSTFFTSAFGWGFEVLHSFLNLRWF
jgi:hypothetical protein